MISFGQMKKLKLRLRNLYNKAQVELGLALGFPDSGAQALNPAGRTNIPLQPSSLGHRQGDRSPGGDLLSYQISFYAGLSARKSGRWVS